MAPRDPLHTYRAKRNFKVTPEPAEGGQANAERPVFVVQKHWARRLHYDFRLELDGAMKSWAVPKGPSYDPDDKRMAVHVEDHPLSYNTFEGTIPRGEYGAGDVIVWDRGYWEPLKDPQRGYREGKLEFRLHGHKLRGNWALVRMKGRRNTQDAWLLIKEKDEHAQPASAFSVVDEYPDSVIATRTVLPAMLNPQLATLGKSPPSDDSKWLYEIKFDGYRLLARVQDGRAALITRNGHDWTARLAGLARELNAMRLPEGWYDGEIVVPDEQGRPDFQRLQNAFDRDDTGGIQYFLFDLPFCDGQDLRDWPLVQRRERLRGVLRPNATVRFSESFEVPGHDLVASACRMGLEGVIAKRKASPYVSRRSSDWLKLKCAWRQEFVIGGYTAPGGTRTGFGSLLLGVYDARGALRYAGNVGTGFNAASLDVVHRVLKTHRTRSSPFTAGSRIAHRQVQWVEPVLVAEVSFAEWTQGGHVRQAVFQGLRDDKPAHAIVREAPTAQSQGRSTSARAGRSQDRVAPARSAATTRTSRSALSGGNHMPDSAASLPRLLDQQKITHADRVIDAASKTTKGALVRYYALVGPLMMPHLKGRPVSFLRAPQGVGKPTFFQKHAATERMVGVRNMPEDLDPDHDPLIEIMQERGLLSAAQLNVVEFHTWNAVRSRIDRPDRMVFDLDPGKGVPWGRVQEAALLLRAFLNELELPAFVKTSGGQGLHLVVPLQRRYDWDTVKDVSRLAVQHMANTFPDRFSAKSGPRNRVGKIFIDYLRNGFGATTVCAWSARARPGVAASVPLDWSEVEALSGPDRWRLDNIHERLNVGNRPWDDYEKSAAALGTARRLLGHS